MVRRVLVAILAAAVAAAVIGVPTGIIETPWYTRMTPVLWWNYPAWALSSLMTGALAATYVRDSGMPLAHTQGGKTFAANTLSLFAVGCPVCNKLVVMALGMTGAMTWFAPVQPLLALASVGLLAYALRARRQAAAECRLLVTVSHAEERERLHS